MLSSADVVAYLQAQGITAPIHCQLDIPDYPDMPDEICVVELSPSLTPTYEQAFDRPVVRMTVRGRQSNPDSAEALMDAVDRAFMDNSPPPWIEIGGRHVTNIQQFAGPGFLGLEDVSGRRPLFSATYVIELARD